MLASVTVESHSTFRDVTSDLNIETHALFDANCVVLSLISETFSLRLLVSTRILCSPHGSPRSEGVRVCEYLQSEIISPSCNNASERVFLGKQEMRDGLG